MQNIRPKKIFYLINSLHKGGAERQLLTISPKIGGTIVLLEDEIHYTPLPDVPILILSKRQRSGRLAKMAAIASSAIRFIQMIRKENKEQNVIVLSFLERSNIVNLISSAFTGHKAILSIRINLSIQYRQYPMVRWFFKRFYMKAYAITSNSAGVCGQMIEEYNVPEKKVFHVPNCYNAENIMNLASEPMDRFELEQLIESRDYFVCINRLDNQKKIGFQIELIAALKKTFPNICLLVVGDGPKRKLLIQKAEEAGLSVYNQWSSSAKDSMLVADIIFLGHTHNPYRICSFSKGLLLTSDYESLPNVVIEALICKIMVIAADCYFGPREILSQKANYTDPNRSYGLMDCGILLPLIDNTADAIPIWIDHISKILRGDIHFKSFESATEEKLRQYQLSTVIKKWESLLH
jgi:glycosyltransferase involved in cell wall biosynthesis